jgi:type I restriction enzyme S subunit
MIKEKTQNIKSSNQENRQNHGSDNMKEGWEIKQLGEVCLKTANINWNNSHIEDYHYIDLTAVSRDNLTITETTLVNVENAPSRAKKIIKSGDIIFATTRPTLKRLTIIPEKYDNQICSTGFAVLRPNTIQITSEYLFYSLLQDSFMSLMESLQRGASYPAVTDSDVKGFEIQLPPLPEQQRIVSILDRAFAAIDQAKANAEKNLQNAKELFESYLQNVFQNDQWEEKELGDVCLKTDNIKWNNSNENSYHYIDLTAVCRDELKILETSQVNEENAPSRAKKIVKQGDIIFATTRPTLKRLTIIPHNYDNQICSTGFTVLRPNPEKVISSFIFYSLLQESFMNRMESLQRGASYPAVTDSDVKGFLIPIPPIEEQKAIVDELDITKSETKKLESLYQKKIAALNELKKSILQKAFAGELPSPEGAEYDIDGRRPSKKKLKTLTSPERA